MTIESDTPAIIVSNDTHVGPRLVEDLRSYCPTSLLGAFDDFVASTAEKRAAANRLLGGSGYLDHPNFRTAGHHDSSARLADYDHDGIAAGVLFHGSMNLEPIPFVEQTLGQPTSLADTDLVGAGMRIYNRWLADFVAKSPHRHVGLAYLPLTDIPAAIDELHWAREVGLRGVNFPAMRDGALPEYNRKRWEPFWAACEELRMPLVTHVGGATNARYGGLESVALLQYESGAFTSKRAVWWMIFAGVFERHPGLRLVITETPGSWLPGLAEELDALWSFYDSKRNEPLNAALLQQVPRPPSEYLARNVFVGASFASPFEVEQAVLHGYGGQVLWGSDYPHLEGTFVNPEHSGVESVTRQSLRHTFCGLPSDATLDMIGRTAIEVYGLEVTELQRIAIEIGAPTPAELATPIERVPAGASITAFRTGPGGWS